MKQLSGFIEWYFIRAPKSQLIFAKHTILLLEDSFGLITNLVYFFKPWYGDTSLVGRVLSIIIRAIVISTGAIVLLCSSLLLLLVPVSWFLSIVLIPVFPLILIIPAFGLVYYFSIAILKPQYIYPYLSKPNSIKDAMHLSARKLLALYPSELFFTELMNNTKLTRFIIKTGIPINPVLTQIRQFDKIISQQQLLARVYEIAVTHKLRSIRIPHILIALLYETENQITPILESSRISTKDFQYFIDWDNTEYMTSNPPRPYEADFISHTGGGSNRARLGIVTPYLDQVSTDYTRQISTYTHRIPVVRPQIINRIESILQKQDGANVILRGDKGTGKEALIWQIAQLIQLGDLHGALWSKRVVGLDVIASGNIEQIIKEVERSGNIILYINDIIPALNPTSSLLSLLQEALSQQRCNVIISCTHQEYSVLKESQNKLLSESEVIDVNETSREETLHILHSHALEFENKYQVIIPYLTLKTTYDYSTNYVHDTPFPQKAITLLEDTVIEATRISESYTQTPWGPRIIINEPHIAYTLSEKTHIPIGSVQKNEAQRLLTLDSILKQEIVGQSKAIEAVTKVLQRNRAGLRTTTKPVGAFLFAGPTGVGKTHVAKMLAKHYFGSIQTMIRLDMSEYQSPNSIDRLLSDQAGYLLYHVRTTPFALVLLDEIEKANPKILDAFLQVLDEGRLTDIHGSTTDFSQTIVIATTNAGNTELSQLPNDYLYFQKASEILHNYFRIEFLNRFDDIIAFTTLSESEIEQIVTLKVVALSQKLYNDKKIHLEVSTETKKWLATFGYSPELGARNLTRLIQDTIETKLAQMILKGELTSGQTAIL